MRHPFVAPPGCRLVGDAAVVDLVSGARGRSLCLSELCGLSEPFARLLQITESALAGSFDYAPIGTLRPSAEQLRDLVDAIAAVDLSLLQERTDQLALLGGVAAAVDAAMPWQPPFTRDALAAFGPVVEALRPVGEAIAAAPAAAWWGTGLAAEVQFEVAGEPHRQLLDIPPAREALTVIRDGLLEQEQHFPVMPGGPDRAVGGEWGSMPGVWNGPAWTVRPATTRRLAGLGAVELAAQEDSYGPERAALRHVRPVLTGDLRVYEVTAPADWAQLVDRFPFDVSRSRRGVWWQSTGLDGPWFVPDWQAVAQDFDAVHVTVEGYLTTAGEAVPVAGGHSVLGGWNPDVTYWLCDVKAGPVEYWRRPTDDATRWVLEEGCDRCLATRDVSRSDSSTRCAHD